MNIAFRWAFSARPRGRGRGEGAEQREDVAQQIAPDFGPLTGRLGDDFYQPRVGVRGLNNEKTLRNGLPPMSAR